jgi:hypothetical protein
MISNIISVAFNYYKSDELSYEQTKIFCCENILANMGALIKQYHLSPEDLREIDEFIRDDVLDYLLKRYPLTESIIVNQALEKLAKAPDLTEALQNDFFLNSQISF